MSILNQDKLLHELNERQYQAVTHPAGPLLVVAGAGSGKTRTLAYRVAWLIEQGVSPEKILLLTFTRRASQEMIKRASGIIQAGSSVIGKVWGGTFHSIANRLLRVYAKSARLSPEFTILDQSDAEDMLNVIRNDMGFSKKDKRFPRKGTCLGIYSRRMNSTEKIEPILKKHYPWCVMWQKELTAMFKEYVERKQKQQILDYDDLLLYWYYLLQNSDLADVIEKRFDHILVDEYQDTNKIQAAIIQGMRRRNKNITVVGDDAQSIYSFRSATIRNMLEFPEQFENTTVIKLEQNYRSVETILETTNRLIEGSQERYSKELWTARKGGERPQLITCEDEQFQDRKIIKMVLEHYEQGIELKKQAVLFRAASHSASLEIALTAKNIPFVKYGGLRFLEAAHVKDILSFLKIMENPQDEMAWFRILQLLNGVGPSTAAAAFQHIGSHGFRPELISAFEAPPAARQELQSLGKLFYDLVKMKQDGPGAQVDRIKRFYDPLLKRNYDNAEMRGNDVEHMIQLAGGYQSRKKFLADLILDPPASTGDLAGPPMLDEDYLILSTIHSAKGCEWDVVYLINTIDGCIPSDMSTGSDEEIEEELRLAYVATTRARDYLYVLWPMRYYHKPGYSDSYSYAQVSRFFTDAVQKTMDSVEFLEDKENSDSPSDAPIADSISDMLKGMWD